jgi:aldose 1-epimerase
VIVLDSGPARATIDLEHGGRLASLRIDGLEILITTGWGPFAWGSFPMAPFAGRLRDGEFQFDGRRHALPRNDPPNAIHGLVAERSWERLPDAAGPHAIGVELAAPWPFRGRVVQTFDLVDEQLRMTMRLEADEPQPAVIGWHPWFRRRLVDDAKLVVGGATGVAIEIDAASLYRRGPDRLPTGELVDPGSHPWDDCVVGLAAPPVVRWAGRLAVEVASSADHWVIYEESPDGVCIEPQTGPPDGLNLAPRTVEPGRPLEVAMTWRWRADEPDPA